MSANNVACLVMGDHPSYLVHEKDDSPRYQPSLCSWKLHELAQALHSKPTKVTDHCNQFHHGYLLTVFHDVLSRRILSEVRRPSTIYYLDDKFDGSYDWFLRYGGYYSQFIMIASALRIAIEPISRKEISDLSDDALVVKLSYKHKGISTVNDALCYGIYEHIKDRPIQDRFKPGAFIQDSYKKKQDAYSPDYEPTYR